jgi:cytochrome c biogenesis protein CcdA
VSRAGLLAALLAAALLPALPARAAAAPALALTPTTFDFGMIRQGGIVETGLTAANRSARPLAVTIVPLCDCLLAQPLSAVIPAGGSAVFALRYDSRDDSGITRKSFLVTTDDPGTAKTYVELHGTVRAEAAAGQGPSPSGPSTAQAEGGALAVRYYYSPGCRSCEDFLGREVPRLERSLGARIAVEKRDILQPGAWDRLLAEAAAAGVQIRGVPVLVAGTVLLQGEKEIEAGARAALESMLGGSPAAAAVEATLPGVSPGLSAGLSTLAVAAAGLLDGINPCAFTTMVFLVAALAVAGRGRRDVLVIGALFTMAVFLTYLAVGFGLFSALRAASAVPLVSRLLRWVLVAVLAVFAGLSIYDYAVIRRGEPAKILLQLPSALKRQLHRSIHAQARTAALVGGSLLLGFLVSVFEFACTGQVYLPTLAYLARSRRDASAAGLLVLYNACFILPLLVVFAASALGVTSGRIAALYQKRMGAVKLGLAAVFLGLAAFTVWAG